MRIRLSQTVSLAVLALTTPCLFSQTSSSIAFSAPHQIPYPGSATFLPETYVAGDLNGDGNTDLILDSATPSGTTQLQLLTGNGIGGFTSSPLPISPHYSPQY
ncbi:MAG: hypothetical protein ACR2JE_09895 [Acidobacteriaceae bacterium]